MGKISDRMMPQKRAAMSSFSNPSLLLSNIPTLANPVRGFGLPPLSKTASQESISLQEEQPATEQLSESETRQKAPLSHDISRISLRSQSRINFSSPTDTDEQEADSMMPKVMRVAAPEAPRGVDESIAQDILQPKYAAREEEEEEEKLPMQPLLQRVAKDGGLEVDHNLESQLTNTKGGGSPLADEVRTYMEPRFGNDFSQVRVHTDSAAVQMNRDLSAQAFTHGSDIYFGAGKNPAKDELTAHELTHVVQQTGGNQQNSQVQRRLQSEPKSEVSDQTSAVSSNKESFKQPPIDKQEALADKVAQEQSSKGTEKEQPQGKQPNGNVDSNRAEENKNQPQTQNQPQVEQVNPQQSGGGGTKANHSMGSQGQASEAVAQQAAPLNAEDPGQILEQLKNTPPTQAFATYTQAETTSAQALENQRQQLQATIPEIPAPTGLSPQKADAAPKNSAPATPQLPEPASAQGQENPVAGSVGGLSGAIAASKSSQNREKSSQEPDINAISTDAGERPKVDMTGEADPSQMHGEQGQSLQQVQAAKGKAASSISQDFGENNIFPKASNQTLKANKELSKVSPSSGKGGEIPIISPEIVGGLNQGLTPYYQAKIAPEQQKYLTGKQQFEADSGNAREDSNQQITSLNQEAKQKQLEQQKQTQQEVTQARQDWQSELDNAEKDYQDKAGKATKEQQQKIDDEKAKGEKEADQKVTEAEQEAADKKKKAEEDAAAKEKEKSQRKSVWQRIAGFFKDIWDDIREAVSAIFDFVRKAVKAIFDAVKKVVKAIIDVVRTVIVGLIKAFGVILKGLVKVVFAAFPEISKKFTDAIDKAVNKATEIVNSVADFLQKAVSAILDFLSNILDKLLGLAQGIYNAAFTVIGMIITGEFAELFKRFGYLIDGAKAMPDQFETAALEELMGGGKLDLDKPLAPEELAQAQQAGVNIPGMGGENTPQTGEAGEMPKAPWSEQNVGVDAVEDNMELSPEIAEELMQQSNGEGEVMLTESQEESRSMDAIVSEATGEQQVGGQEQQQIPDDGLSPKQRASIKWELMKDGIKQWFSKNWPILLAALIAATAVIIAAIVASGGAILAALPMIMDILTVVFAADAIARIGGYLSDYLSKSWEGDIQGGGKSLAKALAAAAIELILLLTFEAGKAAVKGGKAAGKAGAKVFRGVAKGAKYTIEKGKVIFKGIAGTGIGKTSKSLRELGEKILERTRFKKAKIEVSKNGDFEIKACINPCEPIGKGSGLKRKAGDIEGLDKLRSELKTEEITKLIEGLGDDVVEKLAQDLGGKNIQNLVKDLGDDVVKNLAKDLGGKNIQDLVNNLGNDVVKNLAKDLAGENIQKLVKDLGDDVVKNLSKDFSGKNIQELVKDLGDAEVKVLATKLSGTDIKQLLNQTTNSAELSQLLKQVGGAKDAATLLNLLKQAGSGQSAKLLELLKLVKVGDHARLNNLLALANGNAADLQRLANTTLALPKTTPAVPNIPAPSATFIQGGKGANMRHFLDGHTFDYLNIPQRLGKSTTMWPRGTTPQQISNYLNEAINELNKLKRLPNAGIPEKIRLPSNGIEVQVGVTNGWKYGQFFPTGNNGFQTITQNEMNAIWDILKP